MSAVVSHAAPIVRVIDGDTIDVDHVRYRLHGIDAPEAGQLCNGADGQLWECGQESLHRMEELLIGRSVRCDARDRDVYGRTIAICVADGEDINAEMVKSGLAWAFRKYSEDYVPLENIAAQQKVGIWQAETQTAWDFRAQKWSSALSSASDGRCPIKGNINRKHEKIYHAPWSKDYGKTKIDPGRGERWFCSEGQAIAAGWRPPAWGR